MHSFFLISLSFFSSFLIATELQQVNTQNSANLIPRTELFSSPQFCSVSINPAGTQIAYLAPSTDGILNIHIAALDEIDRPVEYISEKHWPVQGIQWTYNPNFLIYNQDNNGDENNQLYVLDLSTGKALSISDEQSVSELVGVSRKLPDSILYSTNSRDPRYFDIWEYNLISKKHDLVYENNSFSFIVADDEFKIRVAGNITESGYLEILCLQDGSWVKILSLPPESVASFKFLGFSQNNDSFYLTANNYSDTAMLYRYDMTINKLIALAKEEESDIGGIYVHPETQEVEAYIHEYEKTHVTAVDNHFLELWSFLEEHLTGEIHLISRSDSNNKWIVLAAYDTKPSDFFLFDTTSLEIKHLFTSRPNLSQYELQEMHPVILSARDGLKLVSYLTLPQGTSLDDKLHASKPNPLIILVHGGPVGIRDSWGFNPLTQFLANRGYAVLSVNYRGSGGFGKSFIEKSFGQWSKNMQNDLIDGMDWAIQNGITTADRVIIMGGSYGGYAALVGLSMTPELFAAGIDIVGPSNLETLLATIPEYWKPSMSLMRKKLGLPEESGDNDKKLLAEISPLTYAHQITKPLLIMHGANDPRVKQNESEQIVAVLRDKKIPFIYALFPDEGHGFTLPENKIAAFAIAEHFLGDLFNTPVEPIQSSLKESSVIIQGLED